MSDIDYEELRKLAAEACVLLQTGRAQKDWSDHRPRIPNYHVRLHHLLVKLLPLVEDLMGNERCTSGAGELKTAEHNDEITMNLAMQKILLSRSQKAK